ncbi:MAG: hypothetical protein OEZ58_11535 [Gammaproteobacteria bacterium]|nr:hypothetical protein [Gammaproteobacteria bacterium]MDH5729616.1 hypothetical protein [Gammaproteobacteria bacterium]
MMDMPHDHAGIFDTMSAGHWSVSLIFSLIVIALAIIIYNNFIK